jgi:hypothetical protein
MGTFVEKKQTTMASNRFKVGALSNIEILEKCRKGGLHISLADLGVMGGTQDIFHFHPQMLIGPHFSCALCGALVRTYSGVYKHVKYCKCLKGNIANKDNQKCKQAVGNLNSTVEPAKKNISTSKTGGMEFLEHETDDMKDRNNTIRKHVGTATGPESATDPSKPDEVLEHVEKVAVVTKDKPKTIKNKRMMNELNSTLQNQGSEGMESGKRRTRSKK